MTPRDLRKALTERIGEFARGIANDGPTEAHVDNLCNALDAVFVRLEDVESRKETLEELLDALEAANG